MKIGEIFNEAICVFNLSAADISRKSGISESEISRFRKGRSDVYATKLLCLLNAMPKEVAAYCLTKALLSLRSENLTLIEDYNYKRKSSKQESVTDLAPTVASNGEKYKV